MSARQRIRGPQPARSLAGPARQVRRCDGCGCRRYCARLDSPVRLARRSGEPAARLLPGRAWLCSSCATGAEVYASPEHRIRERWPGEAWQLYDAGDSPC